MAAVARRGQVQSSSKGQISSYSLPAPDNRTVQAPPWLAISSSALDVLPGSKASLTLSFNGAPSLVGLPA